MLLVRGELSVGNHPRLLFGTRDIHACDGDVPARCACVQRRLPASALECMDVTMGDTGFIYLYINVCISYIHISPMCVLCIWGVGVFT